MPTKDLGWRPPPDCAIHHLPHPSSNYYPLSVKILCILSFHSGNKPLQLNISIR